MKMKILMLLLAMIPFAASQAQTALQWKFVSGDTHEYRLTQTAQLKSGTGDSVKLIADVAEQIDFTWKVVEVNAEGTATLSIQVNSFSLTAKGPDGQEVAYDSQTEEDPQGYAAMLLPIGRRLHDEAVQFSMTTQGEVKILDLPTDLAEAVRSLPGGKLFAKDGGAISFESLARLGGPLSLPASEVQEGSSWTETTDIEIPFLGKASVEFIYEISQLRNDKPVLLEQKMSLSLIHGDSETPWSLQDQVSAGGVQFDTEAGRPETATLNYKVELFPESNLPEGNPGEPMTLQQKTEFRLLSDVAQ